MREGEGSEGGREGEGSEGVREGERRGVMTVQTVLPTNN